MKQTKQSKFEAALTHNHGDKVDEQFWVGGMLTVRFNTGYIPGDVFEAAEANDFDVFGVDMNSREVTFNPQ